MYMSAKWESSVAYMYDITNVGMKYIIKKPDILFSGFFFIIMLIF